VGLGLVDEAHDAASLPHAQHVIFGEFHDGEEPLPEGERPVGQGLLAELVPRNVLGTLLTLELLVYKHNDNYNCSATKN